MAHVAESKGGDRTEKSGAATRDSGDAVVVSSGAERLSKAAGRDKAAFNERLEVVRAQLRGGSYQIDMDRLARRIVEEELARGR